MRSSAEGRETTSTRRRWLTSSRKDGQPIIHVDPEDQEDVYTDGVREDLLHRQRRGAEVFYIHRNQVVAFLVISNSLRCNLWLFQSGVGSVWMCLNTGSSVLVDCKFGSEGVDEEIRKANSGGSRGRPASAEISSRINHIDGRGSRKDRCLQRISRRINHIIGRGSRRASTWSGGAREVVHFGTRTDNNYNNNNISKQRQRRQPRKCKKNSYIFFMSCQGLRRQGRRNFSYDG